KSAVLESLFAEHIHSITLQFLQMLVQRERESFLGSILARFLVLSDEAQGITSVRVLVHSELSMNGQMRLQNALSTRLNRNVRLEVIVDPGLMGGIVLKIGDTVYDGSVRHQLSLLQARLHAQA
ncbi:MAG: ATP synthase F1 subunit delta, partial [Bacteroidetes bacterium]|nr:ATP synthase F1 subunit delta [Bacteroidota bacterium]